MGSAPRPCALAFVTGLLPIPQTQHPTRDVSIGPPSATGYTLGHVRRVASPLAEAAALPVCTTRSGVPCRRFVGDGYLSGASQWCASSTFLGERMKQQIGASSEMMSTVPWVAAEAGPANAGADSMRAAIEARQVVAGAGEARGAEGSDEEAVEMDWLKKGDWDTTSKLFVDLDDQGYPKDISRGVFCNRSLNLRNIDAIGYDMDYTLVHYSVEQWEGRAYEDTRKRLIDMGWPLDNFKFDPATISRGLILDKHLGNILKADRHGFVKKAAHGTRMMKRTEMRNIYRYIDVNLNETRFEFLNTLFSISEACLYAQCVDLLDKGLIPGVLGYLDLYDRISVALGSTHIEGDLKAQVMARPSDYVVTDAETPQTLLDQRQAGKQLVLITNSDWHYTQRMMSYAFDPFLPRGLEWRDLFTYVVVSARKPDFFFNTSTPAYEVVDDTGMLRQCAGTLQVGKCYVGGNARLVEKSLGLSGNKILYVGDHPYGDVNASKRRLRWHTALILFEFDSELKAIQKAQQYSELWRALSEEKEYLEHQYSLIRLSLARQRFAGRANPRSTVPQEVVAEDVESQAQSAEIQQLRKRLETIDRLMEPLMDAEDRQFGKWGSLFRAGNEKSHITRQIEKYADIYTARVSNLLQYTPYKNFRSERSSLVHDPVFPIPSRVSSVGLDNTSDGNGFSQWREVDDD